MLANFPGPIYNQDRPEPGYILYIYLFFVHVAFWNGFAGQTDVCAKWHQGLFIVATVNLGLKCSSQGRSAHCATCTPGKKHKDSRANMPLILWSTFLSKKTPYRTCHTSLLSSHGWTVQACFSCKSHVGRKTCSTIFLSSGGLMKSEFLSKINVPGVQCIAASFQGIQRVK